MNENLKQTWRHYALFFAGVALVWISSNWAKGVLSSILVVLGAGAMFVAALLLMLWTRKKAKQEKENEE